jgi:glycosyltransferase involved in cell wall biosynthesis
MADTAQPLVSVVTTTWNAADYLREAIDSALAQTYRPLEIVVVDDGSTDHTAEVCAAYGDRIRYFRRERDGSRGGGAIAQAYAEARGEYLAPLDHDDLWRPEKIERQMAAIQAKPGTGAVFTRFRLIDSAGADKGPSSLVGPSGEVFHALLRGNRYCYSSSLFPRSVFETIGRQQPFADGVGLGDWDLWLRIARHFPVIMLDDCLTDYRVHETSYAANGPLMAVATERTLTRRLVDLHPDCKQCQKAVAAGMRNAASAWLGHFHACLREGRVREGFRSLSAALKLSPRSVLNPRQPLALAKSLGLAAAGLARGRQLPAKP